jgi:NAD(P)-dependent dehydrogenase (short-subunit alcohol dehydrogenase family)
LRAAASEAGVELDVRALDVTDEASVRSCVEEVVADHGHLDAVVNNAGAGQVGTIENVSLEEVRRVMEVNFFGVVAVTKASMAHLRRSAGRLVTVSSVGGAVGQPFNEAYCAAKFAVEGFMEALAPVAATVGVRVSVVEPGPVLTEFVNNIGVDPERMFAEAGPYEPALQAYVAHVMEDFSSTSAQSPEQVADVVTAVLHAEAPKLRVQTSPWADAFVGTKLTDLDGSVVVGETGGWVR